MWTELAMAKGREVPGQSRPGTGTGPKRDETGLDARPGTGLDARPGTGLDARPGTGRDFEWLVPADFGPVKILMFFLKFSTF